MNNNKLPELLAPCGSMEALEAALAGGADAVYLGGTMFNARMNAKNFDRAELTEAVKKCHGVGARIYVTFNTLVYDREMKSALEYAKFLYEAGVDALIIADIGLATLIRKYFPDFEIHASTQAVAHNADSVRKLAQIGFSRVVCARELNASDIESMINAGDTEIEMFVHGAMCVSCSGECLMSAMLGGRSGNRGECAQPCRMPYNGSYPLSLKDMCLASHIPEIIEMGVASLKIEGRMKSPSYVYGVTSIYRKLLDERRAASPAESAELAKIFSRGGFTDGYFTGKVDDTMLGIRSEKNINDSRSTSQKIPPINKRLPEITVSDRKAELPKGAGSFARGSALDGKVINSGRFVKLSQIPQTNFFDHIYVPISCFAGKATNTQTKPDGVVFPTVIYESELDKTKFMLDNAVKNGIKHALIGNIGHLDLARDFGLIPHGDYKLNITNSTSAVFYADMGLDSILLSPELILPQLRDVTIGDKPTVKGVVAYGRLPLMHLRRLTGLRELRDNRNTRFPVILDGKNETVYNSVPTYMADQLNRLDDAGIRERHFIFSTEDRNEVLRAIYAYQHKVIPKDPVRRIK